MFCWTSNIVVVLLFSQVAECRQDSTEDEPGDVTAEMERLRVRLQTLEEMNARLLKTNILMKTKCEKYKDRNKRSLVTNKQIGQSLENQNKNVNGGSLQNQKATVGSKQYKSVPVTRPGIKVNSISQNKVYNQPKVVDGKNEHPPETGTKDEYVYDEYELYLIDHPYNEFQNEMDYVTEDYQTTMYTTHIPSHIPDIGSQVQTAIPKLSQSESDKPGLEEVMKSHANQASRSDVNQRADHGEKWEYMEQEENTESRKHEKMEHGEKRRALQQGGKAESRRHEELEHGEEGRALQQGGKAESRRHEEEQTHTYTAHDEDKEQLLANILFGSSRH